MEVACDCDAYGHTQQEESSPKIQSDATIMSVNSKQRNPFFQPSPPLRPIWSFGGYNEWKPKFISYCKESSRMATFGTWPKQMNPKPEQLAKSGFFYEGVSDTCRCFFCGVLVHNWEVKDDAFEEHLKHSPDCQYIRYHM